MKNKIITAALSLILLINLTGCTKQAKTQPVEPDTANQTVSANSSSDTDINDDIADEPSSASGLEKEPFTESAKEPAEEKTPVSQPTVSTEPPKQTGTSKPTETPTESTKPAVPSETEKPKPTEQPKVATANDCKAIADKIIQYINSYRSTPATKLPGLTKYAEYRSRQLVSNFAHDTKDERAAATALQYGEYIEPSLYGMTGDPYYTACARDAIAKAAYHGTVDEVAKKFALLVKNSPEHWAYVGDASYQYIAVGLTYNNGTWYCDIAVALENTDNK